MDHLTPSSNLTLYYLLLLLPFPLSPRRYASHTTKSGVTSPVDSHQLRSSALVHMGNTLLVPSPQHRVFPGNSRVLVPSRRRNSHARCALQPTQSLVPSRQHRPCQARLTCQTWARPLYHGDREPGRPGHCTTPHHTTTSRGRVRRPRRASQLGGEPGREAGAQAATGSGWAGEGRQGRHV